MLYYYEVTYWTRARGVHHQQFKSLEEATAFNLAMLKKGYRTHGAETFISQQSYIVNPDLWKEEVLPF